jgi:Recombination endonuclease VII
MTKSEEAQDARLRRVYKKTLADKEREIAEQGGGCAICGRPYPQYRLNQDHDHACCKRPRGKKGNTATFCGKCNRGWLCYLCNKWAIGALEFMAKVNIPIERAVQYLSLWHTKIKDRGGYESKSELHPRRNSSTIKK